METNFIQFTKIDRDNCGNPRYVCHYLNLADDYEIAIKLANSIGGRKFHNKQYGGGLVFQSYNIGELEKSLLRITQKELTPLCLDSLAKVENMTSSNGNDIPNQFIVRTSKATIFQSYSSIIAIEMHGLTILDRDKWDYSTTTGRYRNQFLGETKKETQQKIDNGTYVFANLNI